VALAPFKQGLQHRAQLLTDLGQKVFGTRRMLLVEAALDDPRFLEAFQPQL